MAQTRDPEGEIRKHITEMLGSRTELKELYVERFCLCLERQLRVRVPRESPLLAGHLAATAAIEAEIEKRDPGGEILNAMKGDGMGRLQPCSHKAFRRYDIILSSIGCGKWRGTMPMRGTDGFERVENLKQYLDAINSWIEKKKETERPSPQSTEIRSSLGEPNKTKMFLASLLVSLLQAQAIAAEKRAERSRNTQNAVREESR
ncbi:hypothetical protein ACFL1X_06325 [Candidatus Hydrogenedentota bacterium]